MTMPAQEPIRIDPDRVIAFMEAKINQLTKDNLIGSVALQQMQENNMVLQAEIETLTARLAEVDSSKSTKPSTSKSDN